MNEASAFQGKLDGRTLRVEFSAKTRERHAGESLLQCEAKSEAEGKVSLFLRRSKGQSLFLSISAERKANAAAEEAEGGEAGTESREKRRGPSSERSREY